jgi:hypothetical protein
MDDRQFEQWSTGFIALLVLTLIIYTIKRMTNTFVNISFVEIWGSLVILLNIVSGLLILQKKEE